MNMVRLHNGAEEAEPAVRITMISLQLLAESNDLKNAVALNDLVCLCRDSTYKLLGDSTAILLKLSLIGPTTYPPQAVRNIVLSAAVGDGFVSHLRSPIDTTEDTEKGRGR